MARRAGPARGMRRVAAAAVLEGREREWDAVRS
jgi:hypothetical protein